MAAPNAGCRNKMKARQRKICRQQLPSTLRQQENRNLKKINRWHFEFQCVLYMRTNRLAFRNPPLLYTIVCYTICSSYCTRTAHGAWRTQIPASVHAPGAFRRYAFPCLTYPEWRAPQIPYYEYCTTAVYFVVLEIRKVARCIWSRRKAVHENVDSRLSNWLGHWLCSHWHGCKLLFGAGWLGFRQPCAVIVHALFSLGSSLDCLAPNDKVQAVLLAVVRWPIDRERW